MNQNTDEEETEINESEIINEEQKPLELRIISKYSQIRKAAYEEISSSALHEKYKEKFDDFLSDSSKLSLKSAADLVLSYIQHKQLSPNQAEAWTRTIIEKTYGCNDKNCQEISKEIICELITNHHEIVMGVIKGILSLPSGNKNMKKIMQCEKILEHLISEYGDKLGFEYFDGVIKNLLGDKNPGVKSYAMMIIKYIYKWDKNNAIANEVLKDKEKDAIDSNRDDDMIPNRTINTHSKPEETVKDSEGDMKENNHDDRDKYYFSSEFLDKLTTKHQKTNEKKKLLEELTTFLINQPKERDIDSSFNKYQQIFDTTNNIMNENNPNVITAVIELLSHLSKVFLKNKKYIDFLSDIIPKLLDKFNLQSNLINNEIHRILSEFIQYNVSFDHFFVYLENISMDDNIIYTINILTFAFEQIKKDDKWNINNFPGGLIDLFEKLSSEDNNEISNLAFNTVEILNMRNETLSIKKAPSKKEKKKEEEKVKSSTAMTGDVDENQSSQKGGKSFRGIKKKKENPKMKMTIENDNDDIGINKAQIDKEPDDSQVKEVTKHGSNKALAYDNIVIGPGKKPNPLNDYLTENEPNYSQDNISKPILQEIPISKPSNKNVPNYDDRVVGGKSNFNEMFSDEIEQLPIAIPKKSSKKTTEMAIDNMTSSIEAKKPPNKKSAKDMGKEIQDSVQDIKLPSARESYNNDLPIDQQDETYTKESKEKSLSEFQKKMELALQQEESNLARKDSNDGTETKKTIKDESHFDDIKGILGKEIVLNMDGAKWEMKKQALEDIQKLIQSNSIASSKTDDLFTYLKYKLKDFKETNFNINREAITAFTVLFNQREMGCDSKHYLAILNAYHDKLSDSKLKDQVNQLISTLIDIQGATIVIKALIVKLQKKLNVNLLKEYSVFFAKCVEDYDINTLPIKEIVDLCKVMAANSNPQVRTASTSLLCALYKYIGNDIKILIKDIKESTLKIIEAELDKITVIAPLPKKKKATTGNKAKNSDINNPSNEAEGKGMIKNCSNDLIPRVDISKKITPKLLKDINEGKWPEKKEACEAIEKIISDSYMKILPNGLADLFALIKNKLSDGNKNIVRMIISLLSKLIEASGSGFRVYSKSIALALLPNFADKMQVLREECHACFDKWVTFVGFDSFVSFIPSFLKTDNLDLRIEILKLIMKNKELFNKSMGEAFFKEMVGPLLLCLQDKASTVRTAAEEMILFSLQYININNYHKGLKDFKPAIANDLKHLLNAIKNDERGITITENNTTASASISITPVQESNNSITPIPSHTQSHILKTEGGIYDSQEKACVIDENRGNSIKVFKKKKTQQLSSEDLNVFSKQKSNNTPTNGDKLEVPSVSSSSTIQKSPNTSSKTNSIFSSNKKSTFPKFQVFLSNINIKHTKERRFEGDKKYKFSLDTVTIELENKLRDLVKGLFTEDFIKRMFSNDFKQIVEALNGLRLSIQSDENIPAVIDNLDLILKIIGCKMNTNQTPSMIKALFDFLESLHTKLSPNVPLNETETYIIITLLVDRLGMTTNTYKDFLLILIENFFTYITPSKAMITALNLALGKNIKIKSEILDICTDMYLNDHLDIINRQYARMFSRFLSTNDNNTKSKAIALFKEIYSKIGDEMWSYIEINEKEKEFLEANLYEYQDNDNEEEYDENDDDDGDNNAAPMSNYKSDKTNNETNQQQHIHLNAPGNFISNYTSNYQTNFNTEPSALNNNNNPNGPTKINTSNLSLKDQNELLRTLKNLITATDTEKVNIIIILHEFICAKYEDNKDLLVGNIDNIIKSFIESMNIIFSNPDISKIDIKFTKYLATVLCKIASNKELICRISYPVLFNLSEKILLNLLIENLDKIGENCEGSTIFKSLNSTMLRILENCNSTYVIISLLDLIKNNRIKDSKLAELAIKCLLKVNQNIPQIINSIEIDKILLQFHLLLCDFEKTQVDLQAKTQTDQMILRYIKNCLNEIVKIKKENILNDYIIGVKSHATPDKYIMKWIKNVLSSLNIYPQYPNQTGHNPPGSAVKGNTNSGSNNYNYMSPSTGTGNTGQTILHTQENKKDPPVDRKLSAKKGEIMEELKYKTKQIQGKNNNQHVTPSKINANELNNTLSELKKKWNDVNKKGKKK